MIEFILNVFRKNKICTYIPGADCSGTGVAVVEFLRFKEGFERASERKVRLVKTYTNFFGCERIKYVIEVEK